jgi:hypothetical protein
MERKLKNNIMRKKKKNMKKKLVLNKISINKEKRI